MVHGEGVEHGSILCRPGSAWAHFLLSMRLHSKIAQSEMTLFGVGGFFYDHG